MIEFGVPDSIQQMKPAQFFMIGTPGSEPLLRRPYSVCGLNGTFPDNQRGTAQVLYKVYGKGTRLLSGLGKGAELQVLGPLGNGFDLPDTGRRALLVAGGIGSAPFPLFIRHLAEAGHPAPRMIYGARSQGDLPLLSWFRDSCEEVLLTTDDGSAGEAGRVTQPLERLLEQGEGERLHLYVCGPDPMLKAVARLASRFDVPCDLALEAPMACGFGVCLGCVVPVHGDDGEVRFERVCVDGPVMPAQRMAW
ncbi:hypothetical protein ABI59_01915 [Acidobacteria bacterium Mor1]|nr:hypothetical protein ABI59_01915 [Acidobacteria bacterium Mor1]